MASLCRQWAMLCEGGIPVRQALGHLAMPGTPLRIRRAVRQLSDAVNDGDSLSQAIAEHPRTFPPYFGAMLRIGEQTGTLEAVIGRLAAHFEDLLDLQRKFLRQCAYPFAVLIGIVIGIPIVVAIVSAATIGSPDLTWHILWILYYGLRPFVLAACAVSFLGHVAPLKRYVRTFLLRLWPVGSLVRRWELARFHGAMELLMEVGYAPHRALALAAGALELRPMRRDFEAAIARLQNRITLTEALRGCKWLMKADAAQIEVGEASGRLDETFGFLARQHRLHVMHVTRAVVIVLEGVLIMMLSLSTLFDVSFLLRLGRFP